MYLEYHCVIIRRVATLFRQRLDGNPAPHLQVCGPLEGLVAQRADVAAVLAVGLPTVVPQRVGVFEHLVAVVALVPGVGLCLAVLPALMSIVVNLVISNRHSFM